VNLVTGLDERQRRAVGAAAETLVVLTGPPGSGKTTALVARAASLAADPSLALERIIVSSPVPQAGPLRALVRDAAGPERSAEIEGVPWIGGDLATVAHAILAENALASQLALDLRLIDEEEAEIAFERAGASLFALEWTEFVSAEIDPELAGMRAPERFAAAALRLFRKLRTALIGPEEFLDRSLRGAVEFYSSPPNFADPALLGATRDEYRASLGVDAQELQRQRLREVDLAKVLGRLYQSYLDELVKAGCLTPPDAIAEATRLLCERPEIAQRCRTRFVAALIDDAQDLTLGAVRFLQALFGKELAGVTLAGDRDQATQTLAGARPQLVFSLPATTIELDGSYRARPAVVAAARAALGTAQPLRGAGSVTLFRGRTQAEEAAFIADEIASLLAGGTAPDDIALVVRSFVWMRIYRDPLTAAGVPVKLRGAIDLYDEPDVEDALALLWSAHDPFRHEWLLRALATPTVRLNDLGLYLLCGEPSNPQTALFELRDDGDSVRSRWDRRRNLRLALNVVRGDRDADLDEATRAVVTAFRRRRAAWERTLLEARPEDAAARIIVEGGLRGAVRGESAARAALRDDLLDALLRRIAAYVRRDARRTLGDFLTYVERTSLADRPPFDAVGTAGVEIGSVDALKGREFAHVFVCNLRAGAFPAYYSPDSFLFSTTYGVIPKDNVGDAETARTAKFTWYSHHAKLKELYTGEDRRALFCAIARAREGVTLTASGRPTRGIGAPEFLAELQAASLPFAEDRTGGWRPRRERSNFTLPERVRSGVHRDPACGPPLVIAGVAELQLAQRCPACARRALLARAALATAPAGHEEAFENGIVDGIPDGTSAVSALGLTSPQDVERLLHALESGEPSRDCTRCVESSAADAPL
jgi:superfamily I DNA/RNA helicase